MTAYLSYLFCPTCGEILPFIVGRRDIGYPKPQKIVYISCSNCETAWQPTVRDGKWESFLKIPYPVDLSDIKMINGKWVISDKYLKTND